MKKIVFYIPAILFTILYIWVVITFGMVSISPLIFAWIALFLVSGVLLSKDKFWGGILRMLPGIYFIYMGANYTGQRFSERAIGVIALIFYMFCSGYIFYKKASTRITIE